MNHMDSLRCLGACEDAIDWAGGFPDLASAWSACQRGDWMLWLAGRYAGEPWSDLRRPLVLAACECARLVLPRVPEGELRPLRAIETAERWALGVVPVTNQELRDAADAAATTATTAAYAAAFGAAAAAAAAAYAAADAAAYAAGASASAFGAYGAAACADIIRKHYQTPPAGPTD